MNADVTTYPDVKIDAGSLDRVLLLVADSTEDLSDPELAALDRIRLAMIAAGYVPLLSRVNAAHELRSTSPIGDAPSS